MLGLKLLFSFLCLVRHLENFFSSAFHVIMCTYFQSRKCMFTKTLRAIRHMKVFKIVAERKTRSIRLCAKEILMYAIWCYISYKTIVIARMSRKGGAMEIPFFVPPHPPFRAVLPPGPRSRGGPSHEHGHVSTNMQIFSKQVLINGMISH